MAKTLEVGKTYNHSVNGRESAWTIVDQWSDDLFEGKHHAYVNNQASATIMFNKHGKPIGARGKFNYTPDSWHLVFPEEWEYVAISQQGWCHGWQTVSEFTAAQLNSSHLYVLRNKEDPSYPRVLCDEDFHEEIKQILKARF